MFINTGCYSFEVDIKGSEALSAIDTIYADAPKLTPPPDFRLCLKSPSFIRKFIRPQVSFYCDQYTPFKPLGAEQAYALLEWGMNWCISNHEFTRLVIHSAVAVKNGKAIIFPAEPGAGKSTLSAFLAMSGWSLYSDELAIIEMGSLQVNPLFRPVCLKNNSISLVKEWFPKSIFTKTCSDTHKGDVAHLKASTWEQYKLRRPVDIAAVVFPKYVTGKDLTIFELNQLEAFETLSKNAFNYGILGRAGFESVFNIVSAAKLFEIEYESLTEVERFLLEEIIK